MKNKVTLILHDIYLFKSYGNIFLLIRIYEIEDLIVNLNIIYIFLCTYLLRFLIFKILYFYFDFELLF